MHPAERERFQDEATRFAEFLGRWLPDYRRTRRGVSLTPETSERLRLFWAAVGYCAMLGRVIASPAEVSGHRRIRSLLAQWRQRGAVGAEVETRLPSRFRLVEELEGGFRVTDETGPGDDVPVLDVSESFPEPAFLAPSYLYFTANALLRLVFGRWFNFQVTVSPPGTTCPFPQLQPNLVQYGEGLLAWADSPSPDAPPRMMAYRDFRTLILHIQGLEGQRVEQCPRPPGHILWLSGFATLTDELSRLRHFHHEALGPQEHEKGGEIHHWVGEVDGLPVWFLRESLGPTDELQAGIDSDDRERWETWLSARGVGIVDESPVC